MTMLGGNIRSNRRRDGAAAPRKMLITWAGVKLWTPPPPDAIQMRCLNLRKRGLDAQLSTLRPDLLVSTPTDARPFILTSHAWPLAKFVVSSPGPTKSASSEAQAQTGEPRRACAQAWPLSGHRARRSEAAPR